MKVNLRLLAVLFTLAMSLFATAMASAATAELLAATGSGSSPTGIAIDSTGNVYAVNRGNGTVTKVTPSGTVTASWASSVASNSSLIAIGPGDSVLVSGGTTKVQRYSSSGGAPVAEPTTGSSTPLSLAVDGSGSVYFTSFSGGKLGKIAANAGSASGSPSPSISYQVGGVITDSAGNLYVTDSGADKVHKYLPDLTEVQVSGQWPAQLADRPDRGLATDGTYLYLATSPGVTRVKLSDGSVTDAWATPNGVFDSSPIAVGLDGTVYVGTAQSMTPQVVYSITPSGTVATVATLNFDPKGLAVDSSGNVYVLNQGPMGFAPPGSPAAGIYKITLAAPAPTPTPSSSTSSSTTSTTSSTTGKPAPGPALKVSDIPAEITLDIGSSTGGSADQPITAEVPCNAPEGQLLDRCTVNVTAPEYVLLGQGDGISVRATKKVSIGKATVKAKGGKKTIVVKVKINQKGRKALTRNLKITATVGLTAITVSNLKSTGAAETTMRLPTQLISPQQGIFASNSTTLNKAGVAFVNRLAKLLPAKPRSMVFIGFTDITGVPGDNRWIADRRAKAVRDALEAKGVDPARSSIEVKAAQSPRDDNATDQGRERNRRVSIRITY